MTIEVFKAQPRERAAQKIVRWLMGATMIFAGISHLTFARRAFRKQIPMFVPELLPFSIDQVVVWSGIVEITMGAAMVFLPRQRKALGWILGAFYIAVFPGNIAQWQHHRSAFGLDTDAKRFWRLCAQPLLVGSALWSTGAWDPFRDTV
jgi:uncharacterized membrane protein